MNHPFDYFKENEDYLYQIERLAYLLKKAQGGENRYILKYPTTSEWASTLRSQVWVIETKVEDEKRKLRRKSP